MREIRFRAWDKEENKMIYEGDNEYFLTLKGQIVYIGGYDGGLDIDIEPFELLQFTGLKDANDTEIYEGDIVECKPYEKSCIRISQKGLGVLACSKGRCFSVEDFEFNSHRPDKLKVIGNIYENPELLED